MLNVFIITQEEPFFIPKVIRHIANRQHQQFRIVGCTVLKPHRKNKSMRAWFEERRQIYTFWELMVAASLFIYCRLSDRLTGRAAYHVKGTSRKLNIPLIPTRDINSNEYLEQIKLLNIDVIVSISPPQLFGEALLGLPAKGCINAHGTLLPRHRGVFGSWWTLFNEDKTAGTTIHTMEPRLDAGDIIWQDEFEVSRTDTQYSLAYKTKKIMAAGIVEILLRLKADQVQPVSPKYEESYHKAPTKSEGKEFHRKGLNIIRPGDMKYALQTDFD